MNSQQGLFHRVSVALFGERTARLRESTSRAHVLSYLLVTVQSAAVVLALGHAQLFLLLSGDPTIVLIAALAVFLLVATVWAADLCLLATLQRVPILARNRATWALIEHAAYVAFVLAVEGSTLALVLAVLDTDPRALVSEAPIIPAGGLFFAAQIGARAALTCWTAVQLWIVRGKLPPQWSTLLLEARELLGGKAQAVMSGLNLDGVSLASLFDAYAQMSRPPSRVARWWNKGLIAREQLALAREDEQRDAVVRALSSLDLPLYPLQPAFSTRGHWPTDGGTPAGRPQPESGPVQDRPHDSRREAGANGQVVHLPARASRRVGPARRRRVSGRGVRTVDSYEPQARAAWASGARSVARMKSAVPGMSASAASGWVRTFKAESQALASREAQHAAAI